MPLCDTRDINGIALALRETHKDDFFSVPEDNPLKEMLETAGENRQPGQRHGTSVLGVYLQTAQAEF